MTWIADTISTRRVSVLDVVSDLLPDATMIPPFTHAELYQQAVFTLDLLVDALDSGNISPLFNKWVAIGKACAERELSLEEIPNVPDILKRTIWHELRQCVEGGEVSFTDLIDAMMGVETILSDAWFALMRSFTESEDVATMARNERIEALYSLTEVLSSSGDGEDIYRNIVEKVASITGLPRCSLLLLNDGKLEAVASSFEKDRERLRGADTESLDLLAAMASGSGPAVLDKNDEMAPALQALLAAYQTPVLLVVPMRSGDKAIGLLLLDAGHEVEFTREQVDLSVASASQASIAIEKSGLLTEMEGQLKHMAAIGIVARTLTSHLDAKEQLESLLQMATALIRADSGVFMLLEEMFDQLKEEASSGPASLAGDHAFVKMAQWAYDNEQIAQWQAGETDARFGELAEPVQVCLAAPLMVWDKPIGIVGVSSSRKGEKFSKDDVELFGNFAAQAAVSLENTRLYERLQDTYLGAIGSLAAAIEARDPYTVGHSARVTQYAVAIAESMGLSSDAVEELRLAGLLHDLGKIGVPDSILNKAGRLSEEEYSAIKMHPALSMRIIEPLPHLGNIIPIIYHHHERYDGNGYMDGKAGDKIPLGARIIAVADSFEAMTSDRPYRTALSREEAMSELSRNAGSQFDPEVVRHFLALLETA
jgi:HD-GYP domain-containing protein (c-di-GMP phosphodiesterase class II)